MQIFGKKSEQVSVIANSVRQDCVQTEAEITAYLKEHEPEIIAYFKEFCFNEYNKPQFDVAGKEMVHAEMHLWALDKTIPMSLVRKMQDAEQAQIIIQQRIAGQQEWKRGIGKDATQFQVQTERGVYAVKLWLDGLPNAKLTRNVKQGNYILVKNNLPKWVNEKEPQHLVDLNVEETVKRQLLKQIRNSPNSDSYSFDLEQMIDLIVLHVVAERVKEK